MSVRKFCLLLNEAKVGKNDNKWFPPWLRRYASTVEMVQGKLSVTEGEVIRFLQTLRDNGTPAWQRLPVVLSRGEIALLLPEFCGLKRLMFLTKKPPTIDNADLDPLMLLVQENACRPEASLRLADDHRFAKPAAS